MDRGLIGKLTIGVATVSLGVLLSACGGGGSTATISKAEFLKQGNGICQSANKQIEASAQQQLTQGGGRPGRTWQVTFINRTVIPNIQHRIDAIGALGAPYGDEAAVETIISEGQHALDEAKKDPTVLTIKGPGPFLKADKFANSYGLTACGSEQGFKERE